MRGFHQIKTLIRVRSIFFEKLRTRIFRDLKNEVNIIKLFLNNNEQRITNPLNEFPYFTEIFQKLPSHTSNLPKPVIPPFSASSWPAQSRPCHGQPGPGRWAAQSRTRLPWQRLPFLPSDPSCIPSLPAETRAQTEQLQSFERSAKSIVLVGVVAGVLSFLLTGVVLY